MARVTISPDQPSFFDVAAVTGDVDQIQPEVNHVDQDHVDQDLQLPADVAIPVKRRAKEERRQRIADVLEQALAPSTIKSYAKQFRRFEEWCSENDEVALPAEPEAIAEYLIERAEDGLRKATLKIAWAAIADKHRSSGYQEIASHPGIRRTLKGLVKADPRPQVQAKPIRTAELQRIRGAAWVPRIVGGRRPRQETPAEAKKRALLDIAICSTLRDGLLRRGELAALRWGDIQFLEESGLAMANIRRSKTDQEGEGAEQLLGPDCAKDLKAIMPEDALVDPELRVIGLSDSQIGRRVRAICILAGLGDGYTGHSGRVGMAKDLSAAGAELPELMDVGRWSSPEMVARYTKEERAAKGVMGRFYANKAGSRLRDDDLG